MRGPRRPGVVLPSPRATRRTIRLALAMAFVAGAAASHAECAPDVLTIGPETSISGATTRAPLSCVLEEIARLAGADIRGAVGDEVVPFDLKALPLTTALSRLLRGRSYVLLFHGDRLARISLLGGEGSHVLASSAPPAVAAPPHARGEDPALEALRRQLLEDPRVGERKDALDRVQAMEKIPTELVAKVAREDFDAGLRRQALFLIAAQSGLDLAGRSAAEILVRNDPDPGVRAAAAEVLQRQARRGLAAQQ